MSVRVSNLRLDQDGSYLGNMDPELALSIKKLKKRKSIPELKESIYFFDEEIIDKVVATRTSAQSFLTKDELTDQIGELRDEQTLGVGVAYLSKKLLLGDATGLGKSYMSGGLVNLLLSEKPDAKILVFTEKNSLEQFSRDLIRTTGRVFITMTGEIDVVAEEISTIYEHTGVVASHSALKNSLFMGSLSLDFRFDLCIVDESALFKNPSADVYLIAREFLQLPERLLFLNATPLEIVLHDFYHQLDLLDPLLLPNVTTFNQMYNKYVLKMGIKKFAGYKDSSIELFLNTVQNRYYARTREELFDYKIEQHNYIEAIPVFASVMQKHLLKLGASWQEVLNSPKLVDPNIDFCELTIPKLTVLREVLEKHRGSQIFIYCFFKSAHLELASFVNSLGFTCTIVNGDSTLKERREARLALEDGTAEILISNMKRAVNLKMCKVLFFYTLETNPQAFKQIEGRILRTSTPKGMSFYMPITEKTPEWKMAVVEMAKREHYANVCSNIDAGVFRTMLRQLKGHMEKE